ncbi:polyprenyl synthetase family protein [Desulfovibrio sp. OttesenSCG-928-M16]|nr:polyprenyl synthetase family protein [Desulfovibrio sp. OttesenSCG-928-M16]
MRELKLILSREQPRINLELQKRVDELPPGSRAVAAHLLAAGGKRLRPLLTLLCGRAFGADDESLYTLGAAIEMLHTATLAHDDVIDNSPLRRGKAAAHIAFDTTRAVLAGDAMLAKALLLVSAFGDNKLTACIAQAVMRTAEGEIAEFDILRNLDASHDDYLAVITGKTAWMLQAACELGAIRAGAEGAVLESAAVFGLELGRAFQMVDDALDFSPSEETGKPMGGDLREGKITPPLLHYLASLDEAEAALFRQNFKDNSLSEENMDAVSRAIYANGFAEMAKVTAGQHLARADAALEAFPDVQERIVLKQMLEYIKNRKH